MNPRWTLLILLGLLTAARLVWTGVQDLTGEEAYLALCGRHADVAIFDGPAGTPLLLGLLQGTASPSPFALRWLWPLLALVATGALYALARALFDDSTARRGALLLNILPAFNAAAVTASPVMPATMWTLLALWSSWRAAEGGPRGFAWWLTAAGAFALALLQSYAGLLLWPAVSLFLLVSPRHRRQLASAGFALFTVAGGAVLALLLLWNARHGWVHFIGGTWQTFLHPRWEAIPQALGELAFGLSPLVLLTALLLIPSVIVGVRGASRARFLSLFLMLSGLVVLYGVLQGVSYPTVWLPLAAAGLPLMAQIGAHPERPAGRWILPLLALSAAATTIVLMLSLAGTPPALPREAPAAVRLALSAGEQRHGERLFLIAQDAPLASLLTFHLHDIPPAQPGHPVVYVVESPFAASQFALWPRYDAFVGPARQPAPGPEPSVPAANAGDPFTEQEGRNLFLGRSALYISREAPDDLPQAIRSAFGSVTPLFEFPHPDGTALRVYLCEDYQTMPL